MEKTKEQLEAELKEIEQKEKEVFAEKQNRLDALAEIKKKEDLRVQDLELQLTFELVKLFKTNPELLELFPHSMNSCGKNADTTTNSYNNRCPRCYLNEMFESEILNEDYKAIWQGKFEMELKFKEGLLS